MANYKVDSLYNFNDKYDNGIKCPVCNNFMSVSSWHESMGTVEENHKCPHCGYYYEFAYGNYKEEVNRREFIWTYKCYENEELFKKFNKMIQKHIKRHQRKWKLFKISYLHKEPYYTYFCGGNNKIERIKGGV